MVTTTPATLAQYYNGSAYVNFTAASPGATQTHSYRLTLPGYQDVTGNFTATAGQQTSVTGTFTGNASFSSNPSGARIWVDGLDTGLNTPNTVQGLAPGTNNHTYTLKLSGYADQTGTFSIASGQTTSISSTFQASAYFTSTPAVAEIYVALSPGTPVDRLKQTPDTVTGLSDGTYNYKLTLAGYADITGTFTATAGSTTTITTTFTPSANFISTPSNASIYLDGSPTSSGTTPLTITNLVTGLHTYILTKSGYTDYSGSFTASSGSTSYISATFAGSANITSTPSGAEIYLAPSPGAPTDQSITTPRTVTNLTAPSSGATTLWNYTLKLSGYADTSGSFTATAGQTINVPVTFPGSASFSSNPTGSEIWVDGSDTGLTTPNIVTGLSPGTNNHTYILKISGYADQSGTFSITSGTTTTVPLVTFLGSASFTSTPSNASIWIDGSNTGLSTPNTVKGLSAGSHNYTLVLSGYANYSSSFTAADATTTPVTAIFSASAHITSTPSNASIYLDGSPTQIGTTPYTITGLSDGLHTYILTKSGYTDYSGSFTATAGSTIEVPSVFAGSANITSVPTGAEIYLAPSPGTPTDQSITTPRIITNLTAPSSGATTVWNYKLTKSGYADTTGSFTATSGQTINVPVTFPGSAYITSTPSGAEIYIDNVDQSITTPNTVTGLSAGSHNYKLTISGYSDASGSFTAIAGQTVSIPITFAASAYFTSTPSNASIYLDGSPTPIGTTPTTITGISSGDHSYTLTHTGYADVSGLFTATDATTTPVSVTFPGSAYFTSTPDGAEIYLALSPGTPVDQSKTTPNTITGLSNGTYNYRLILTGYQDVTGTFSITAGTTTTISSPFTGNLNISSTPTGARIFIDGTDKGITTPNSITGLSAGTHSYRLILSGYADATGNFSITSGSTTDLSVTFSGSAYISSTPSGAEIWIDGIDKGLTTPNTITGLAAGTRNYKLTKSGYADASSTFTATSGDTVSVPVTFAGSAYIISTPTGAEIYLAPSPGTPTDQSITTPHTLTGLTAQSSGATTLWNYKLTKSGYADTSNSFTATAGQTLSVPATFPGSVYISSDPSGAEIYVDGNDTHTTTPSTITGLTDGLHNYRLTLAGFADTSNSFTITAGTTISASSTFLGSLEMLSNPSGAEIFIDGVDTGRVTPYTITGLSQTTHTFKLTHTGFADINGTFPIVNAETTILSETFLGNLDIGSTPTGASIYLDGSITSIGTTPSIIMGLLSGSHDIKLTLTNYYDWTGTATVANATTTDVNATLTPKYGSINIKSTPHGASIYLDGSGTPIGITDSPTWKIIPDISVGSHTFRLHHIDYGDVTGDFDVYSNQVTQITAVLDPTPGVNPSYAVWDPTTRARLRVYKCKKIDIEQAFSIDKPTLSFDYQITADANPEIIRWQLIIGGNIVIDDVIPATSYGTSTGHITKDVSAYVPSTGTIKLYVESGPDCESTTHENTYLYLDNVQLS